MFLPNLNDPKFELMKAICLPEGESGVLDDPGDAAGEPDGEAAARNRNLRVSAY